MATRIVNHEKNILSEYKLSKGEVSTGSLIKFNYYSKSHDKTPLVYCMDRDNKNKLVSGFNLNYLSEYEVQSVLKEKNFKSMTNYSMYKHSFRSYKLNKITMLKEAYYDLDPKKGKHSVEKDTSLDSMDKKTERQKKLKSIKKIIR